MYIVPVIHIDCILPKDPIYLCAFAKKENVFNDPHMKLFHYLKILFYEGRKSTYNMFNKHFSRWHSDI